VKLGSSLGIESKIQRSKEIREEGQKEKETRTEQEKSTQSDWIRADVRVD
jgi:hypothetical protein